MSEPKIRLSLEVSAKVRALLDDLTNRADSTSLTETIRRSLILFDAFLEHQEQGGRTFFRSKNNKETEVIVLI